MAFSAQDERRLLDIIEKDAIRDLFYSYCQAIDRQDYVKMRELYHEDARDEHGVNPSGSVDEFLESIGQFYADALSIQHHVTNLYIKLEGNYAEAEGYVINTNVMPNAKLVFGGRYMDKLECRGGVWKFLHRRLVAEWVDVYENYEDARGLNPATVNMYKGKVGESDPSYAYFQLFKRGER
jgi:hypothetical protein